MNQEVIHEYARNQFRVFATLVELCENGVYLIHKSFIFLMLKQLFNVDEMILHKVLDELHRRYIIRFLNNFILINCNDLKYKRYTFERLRFSKVFIGQVLFKEYEQIRNFICSKIHYR